MAKRMASDPTRIMKKLNMLPAGELVNKPVEIPTNEVCESIADIFSLLSPFEIGKTYLRNKYLNPARKQQRVIKPTEPPVGTVNEK